MALITSTQFETLTGETAPAEFDLLQDHALRTLEMFCGRAFESAWRTETVQVFADGIAYPTATPVHDASADTWTEDTITGLQPGWQQVSYEGGFGEYEDTNHPHPCPKQLALAVAFAVHTLASPASQTPGAFSSLKVGDYQVTMQAGRAVAADGHTVNAKLLPFAGIGGQALSLAAEFRRL